MLCMTNMVEIYIYIIMIRYLGLPGCNQFELNPYLPVHFQSAVVTANTGGFQIIMLDTSSFTNG